MACKKTPAEWKYAIQVLSRSAYEFPGDCDMISSCYEMEEIISAGKLGEVPEMVRNQKLFAKLQFLKLHHLHNLKSIYWSALAFQHLKEMVVYECPMLKKLPLDSNSAKDRRIVVEREKGWWKNL
ncbi:hypothetical protein LWI28_019685 [Acer negundo]|uniref:Disease resistance protein At4g27190-like leucine-rich repeats domain-containing protein n=1 Tax=Acer negundo TaxID=4023 RepID=A0AAD5NK48_ACENE|nr:hypothetical protein LWI28_019685 [Acer negundo]